MIDANDTELSRRGPILPSIHLAAVPCDENGSLLATGSFLRQAVIFEWRGWEIGFACGPVRDD